MLPDPPQPAWCLLLTFCLNRGLSTVPTSISTSLFYQVQAQALATAGRIINQDTYITEMVDNSIRQFNPQVWMVSFCCCW
ncbi:hypothetical protein V8F06_009492 [Rhypophila decipiens]